MLSVHYPLPCLLLGISSISTGKRKQFCRILLIHQKLTRKVSSTPPKHRNVQHCFPAFPRPREASLSWRSITLRLIVGQGFKISLVTERAHIGHEPICNPVQNFPTIRSISHGRIFSLNYFRNGTLCIVFCSISIRIKNVFKEISLENHSDTHSKVYWIHSLSWQKGLMENYICSEKNVYSCGLCY